MDTARGGMMVCQNTISPATGSFRNPGPLSCHLALVLVIIISFLDSIYTFNLFGLPIIVHLNIIFKT